MTSVNVTTNKNIITVQEGDATTVTVATQGPQGATGATGATGAAGSSNIVQDTTPQLGGDLDANGNDIDMGTNVITDARVGEWIATKTKVDGIENSATADMTGSEIKTAYEGESNTNAFTDAEKTKLSGIATSANNYVHPNHSGEVTSSADGATVIASNIVDEDNLKISNSPSNGTFLQYKDGTDELTWATPTDTNTTYTAGTGLNLSGTEFSVTSLALTTVQEAANESAQLSLTTQEGDVVVRTDENKTYVKNAGTAGTMADFTLLRTPTDSVLSINGNTGAISAAQIASAVEAASDSNTFTDADHTKLNSVESNSTADMTGAEIKTAYEAESDTNAFTDSEKTKLSGIATGATNTAAPHYTSAIPVGDGGLTQNNFTDTLKTKLDGIATGAEVNVQSDWNASSGDAQILNKPTIPTNTDTTYGISCVDGDNSDEEKIRLTAGGSGSGTDDVVLEAGTGLSIARSGDKITFTNTVTDTNTQLTTEEVQDIIGAMVAGGNTETNISVTYDDTNGKLDFVSTDTQYSIQDGQLSQNNFTDTLKTKLDGIEASADATDATNVAAAGAAMLSGAAFTGDVSVTSTDAGSSASPELELYRNSASPADADYLGQLKFTGESDDGSKEVYAKVTGKIDDASSGTEDGLIEFALRKAGSNNIGARLTSTDLKLINGTGLEVAGNISVDGTVDGRDLATDGSKLDGIAANATANAGTITSVTGTSPIASSGGTTPAISISAATTSAAGSMSSSDKTKLDGIAANSNNYAISSDLLDEDDMSSNSATKVPSQQSVKAYVDANTNVGDITGVTAGTGLTGGGSSGAVTVNADVGIGDDKLVQMDDADAADDDYAKFTANGLEGRSAAEVKTDLSLNNVENTAVSTWAGTSNITTLGTIGTGTWQGTAIAASYVATLNQDTTGSAATLTTPRAINGVNFDGSAAITVADSTKIATAGGTFTGSVTFEDAINENVFAITDGNAAIDPDNGTIQTWTLGANRTPTDSLTAGQSVLLMITASSHTITWPTMTWSGGSPPTLSTSAKTAIELWKVGSTLYGANVGDL